MIARISMVFLAGLPALIAAVPASGPSATARQTPRIFMIGHAHIDPVWRWTKEEGQAEVMATFRSALARMREYPDVAFVSSSARFYQWAAEADPAMFEEIKRRVKEGRWNIVGGWWVEPDMNCPLGESLVRQGLYGQLYFEKAFGIKARVGFNPDSFGHPWTLPQILAGQGLSAYMFMRPSPTEKPDLQAPLFQWQAPDGTRIPTIQILGSYNGTEFDLENQIRDYDKRFGETLPGFTDWAVFYGVGDHGGGPTIAAIEKTRALAKAGFPGMRFATLDQYAAAVLPRSPAWPVVDDELQHHARGCYSVTAEVKKWNRAAEWALLSAEKAASYAAAAFGKPYPAERFHRAWEKVLFNQFHDILAGSAIEQAYVDARNDFGFALSEAKDISADSLQWIARRLDTETGTNARCAPFLVFNPQAWAASAPVEIEIQRLGGGRPVLRRADGREIAFQEARTAGVKVPDRIRVAFQDEFSPLSCALYVLDFSREGREDRAGAVAVGRLSMENALVRLTFDPQTGSIASYFDKKSGREYLKAPAAAPMAMADEDDTWGHQTTSYNKEVGRFGRAVIRSFEEGPERGRIQVKTVYGRSEVTQDFTLYRDNPEVYVRVEVDWHEAYQVLKLAFPTVLTKGEATYSIPYGFIRRPMKGEEEPVQTWLDVSGADAGGTFGLALLNDSKCGVDVKNGEIRLTVLHSTAWSHHLPAQLDLSEGFRMIDTGIHEFSYALFPHAGGWREAGIAGKAETFGTAPIVVWTDRHKGSTKSAPALAALSTKDAAITAIKLSEKGDSLVLRLVEINGRPAEGSMRLAGFDKPITFRLRPNEIKTYLVPLDKTKPPRIVNLLEE
jgi:alpha-mannosidase